MTINEIKTALQNGQKVYWQNEAYEVRITKLGDLQTVCKMNGSVQFLQDINNVYVKGE